MGNTWGRIKDLKDTTQLAIRRGMWKWEMETKWRIKKRGAGERHATTGITVVTKMGIDREHGVTAREKDQKEELAPNKTPGRVPCGYSNQGGARSGGRKKASHYTG